MENYLNNIIITIDGPAGSGKDKISKYISIKYNLYQLDSGILYRRLTKKLLKNNITPTNITKIKMTLKSIKFLSPRKHSSLRTEKIGRLTSIFAKNKFIRDFVNSQQKIIVKNLLKKYKGCVIDGRDIGSKVFKNANIKLFIIANIEIRAKRRHKQLIEQGEKSIYSRILKDMELRDKQDKTRKISPMVAPTNAFIIDNSKSFKFTRKQIHQILFNKFNLS